MSKKLKNFDFIDPITGTEEIIKTETKRVIAGGTEDNPKEELTNYHDYACIAIMNTGKAIYLANEELAFNMGFKYDINSGTYYKGGKKMSSNFSSRFPFPPINVVNQKEKQYGVSSPTAIITDGKRYTFGVEIETILGHIPHSMAIHLPINAVYDGSIRDVNNNKVGSEYTTLPLIGDYGFYALKNVLNALVNTKHKQNGSCSIHVHLGNVDFNKNLVVAIYMLCLKIENEIFQILSPSRGKSSFCRKIEKIKINDKIPYGAAIEKAYDQIQKIVGCTNDSNKLGKDRQHPLGAKCGWNHETPRYWWVNFVPTVFNMRGNNVYTIEFRNHQASLNFIKIRNWILILMGLIHYAQNNERICTSSAEINLSQIIYSSYKEKNAKKLIDYINSRKEIFGNSSTKESSEWTIKENKAFNAKRILDLIVS